ENEGLMAENAFLKKLIEIERRDRLTGFVWKENLRLSKSYMKTMVFISHFYVKWRGLCVHLSINGCIESLLEKKSKTKCFSMKYALCMKNTKGFRVIVG